MSRTLTRDLYATLPILRIALHVKAGDSHDCIIKDKVENSVREFAKQSTMHVLMYNRVEVGIPTD